MTDAHAFAEFMRKFWAEEELFPMPVGERKRARERYGLRLAFEAGREYGQERAAPCVHCRFEDGHAEDCPVVLQGGGE